MKNKIEIQILTPATKEQLVELRNEIRKIEGMEAFDLQLPPVPLVQGKMGSPTELLIEAIIAGATHFAADKALEIFQVAFKKVLGRKKSHAAEVEAMSGILPVETEPWKVAVAETKNGARSVTTCDESGMTSVYSNREFSIDPEHTYAVLIGVSDYDDSANFSRIPPVAGNLDEMYSIFTDKMLVGLPFENITRLYNENCITIKDELRRVSRTDDIKTLIIYYSGHGQNTGNNQLSLVAKDTRNIDEELHNDIPYSFIEKMMSSSPADQKIVFIDACHSGLAAQGRNANVFDFEPVLGTFTLASTSAEESSYFKRDAANTYFTSYLSKAFKEGVSSTKTMLSLTDLFNYTSEKLLKNKLPAPVKKAQFKNILADNFYISGNPAFSLEARMNIPKQLYQQGRYEEARREYILLEKEYPDNQQLRIDHLEFERNAEFNKLVKDGDHFYFRDKNYSAAMSRYREALTIKNDESIRDKITDCMNRMKEQTEQRKEAATTGPVVNMEYEPMGMAAQQAPTQRKAEVPFSQTITQPKQTAPIKTDPIIKKKSRVPLIIGAAVLVAILYFVFTFRSEKTMTDTDGSTYKYKGETKDNRPEGEGSAKYRNGNSYEGEWANGMHDGKGVFTFENGTVYTGYFKNNYFHGKGDIKYAVGDEYDGYWSYGVFQGRGLYKYKNGNSYDGNWVNNKENGDGLFTWTNGDSYQGTYKENLREGRGTYTSSTGDIFNCPGCRKYVGGWRNDLKEGWGDCFDASGKLIYEGNFKNNAPAEKYPNR